MKITLRYVGAFVALGCMLSPLVRAEEDKPAPKNDRGNLRVLTPNRHVVVGEKRAMEKEVVTFLGVETTPAGAALTAQLALPNGTGLVVNQIVPKSPAEEALKVHDVLLQLDDQILIEVRQLSVLVRNHREGDEVTLTYLRGGQKSTVKVKLGKHEVPKIMSLMEPGFPFPGGKLEFFDVNGERGDVDGVLSMIQRAHNGEPMRIQIDRDSGPGFRAMKIQTGNSNVVLSDDDGSLELTMKDGTKSVVAKNAKGEQIFAGPVNTPEERKAMPAEVRERLEKLESMHHMSFKTDGDFQGAETRVLRPRGISLPLPAREQPVSPSRFF